MLAADQGYRTPLSRSKPGYATPGAYSRPLIMVGIQGYSVEIEVAPLCGCFDPAWSSHIPSNNYVFPIRQSTQCRTTLFTILSQYDEHITLLKRRNREY